MSDVGYTSNDQRFELASLHGPCLHYHGATPPHLSNPSVTQNMQTGSSWQYRTLPCDQYGLLTLPSPRSYFDLSLRTLSIFLEWRCPESNVLQGFVDGVSTTHLLAIRRTALRAPICLEPERSDRLCTVDRRTMLIAVNTACDLA